MVRRTGSEGDMRDREEEEDYVGPWKDPTKKKIINGKYLPKTCGCSEGADIFNIHYWGNRKIFPSFPERYHEAKTVCFAWVLPSESMNS